MRPKYSSLRPSRLLLGGSTPPILIALFYCKICQRTQMQSSYCSRIWYIQIVHQYFAQFKNKYLGFASKQWPKLLWFYRLLTAWNWYLPSDVGVKKEEDFKIEKQDGGNGGENVHYNQISTSSRLLTQQDNKTSWAYSALLWRFSCRKIFPLRFNRLNPGAFASTLMDA